jgi:hypothetical protein
LSQARKKSLGAAKKAVKLDAKNKNGDDEK